MNRISGGPISQGEVGRLFGGALRRLLFLILFLLANQAMAGYTYRMVGGECTDSNRGDVFYPNDIDGGHYGRGPKGCADQISVEMTVRDGYVPGTWFNDVDKVGTVPTLTNFSINDGARSLSSTFPINNSWLPMRGVISETGAPSVLEILWHEGWALWTYPDGTWKFAIEFGARDLHCGVGSVEGPGGECTYSGGHYFSMGTFQGWQRVPEPATVAVLGLALGLGGLARRRG